MKDADHKVETFERAGKNDYYGYENKPAYNGRPNKTLKPRS